MNPLDSSWSSSSDSSDKDEVLVTEFELQLWRVFSGFLRWQEECERNANATPLSGNELAILHIIRMKNRPKSLTDIERLLNRNDTHNIRYSTSKLLKLGLIKKTLSTYSGKNYYFQITEAGIQDTDNYSKIRKMILINMFKELNLDLEEITKSLTKVKAIYDEADRAVAQNFTNAENPDSREQLEGTDSQPRGRILVVEDHPTTAKVTKKMLSDLNYIVDIASSGDMALSLTVEHNFDIIFMDIELPDIDGYEITRKIRTNQKLTNTHTPIIGLTAQASSENKRLCIEAGMNVVFIKPLVKEKIEDIFSMFISKSAHQPVALKSNNAHYENNVLTLTGAVIDLEQGAKLVGGNEQLAKETIVMLVESFTEELTKLEKACKNPDLIAAQPILHKLRGGVSYCGVPRLKEACVRFDDYLKLGKSDLLVDFYNLILSEFNQVKKVCMNL